jgi:hypothetical protein
MAELEISNGNLFAGRGARHDGSTLADVRELDVHFEWADLCGSAPHTTKVGTKNLGAKFSKNNC